MNRIWPALTILVLLIGMCVWGTGEAARTTTEVSETLTEMRDSMDKGDTAQARELAQSAVETWNGCHHTLSFFIPHERLENISQTLSTTKSYLESGTEDEARAECNRALNQLRTLQETEMPYLNNIL